MLIPLVNIKWVYGAIQEDALKCDGMGCTIYIFVSNDTDSLSSLKIFTSLLKSDDIRFAVVPVFSNKHILEELKKLNSSQCLRSLIFINCGAQIQMSSLWFYKKPDIKAYIMDYHRPYFHQNINEPQDKIVVIHDGCKSFDECPNLEEQRMLEEMGDSDSDEEQDSDEYDSEAENDGDEARQELQDLKDDDEDVDDDQRDLNKKNKKDDDDEDENYLQDGDDQDIQPRQRNQDDEGLIEDAGEEDLAGQEDQSDQIQKSAKDQIVDQKKLKRQCKSKFHKYYRGSFYGRSTSSTMYQLASQLNRNNKDFLWFWIIGLSELIIHCKSGDLEYNREIEQCNDEVMKFGPVMQQQNAQHQMELQQNPAADGNNGAPGQQTDYRDKDLFSLVNRKTENQEVGNIFISQELRFMLLRHWTLEQSIMNSNYMVTKLDLYTEVGSMNLKKFLAKIGVPLDQARQKFQYMEPVLRKSLKERILDCQMAELELDKILTSSYARQVTEDQQISAQDMAYAISSLLEAPHHINLLNEHDEIKNSKINQIDSSSNNQQVSNGIGGDQKENVNNLNQRTAQSIKIQQQLNQDRALENTRNCLNDNFWTAYDCLDQKQSHTLLMKGISLAKEMQQAIVRVGTSLIQRKEVKVGNYFRYVMLENDYLTDVKMFQYPLALQKLGLFVMEAYKCSKQKKSSKPVKDKPLVMSVKNSKSGTTLVIAVMGYNQEIGTRNDFGSMFTKNCEEINIKSRHDSFETGMIEINNNDWRTFIEKLLFI